MLIAEYFQEIESLITSYPKILESRIHKDIRSVHIGIIEGTISFMDESVLHFIEFVDVQESITIFKYSYHYQNREGILIFRYDMAPHHKELENFPHHKHLPGEKVIKATSPALANVLDEIDDSIKR